MEGGNKKRAVRFAVVTDPGAQDLNEDACAAVDLGGTVAILVADGVGGQARGEVASKLVIETARNFLVENAAVRSSEQLLRGAFEAAQRAIRERIESSPRVQSMRTTLLVALLEPKGFRVAHVGDCRAYRVRNGSIEQLTRDDTLVQTLLDLGELDREGARTHSKSNILTQSMGDASDLEFHVTDYFPARLSDVLVICSDGLSDALEDAAIAAHAVADSPHAACEALLKDALAHDAQDNVTVAVASWSTPSRNVRARRKRRRSDTAFAAAIGFCLALLGLIAIAGVIGKRASGDIPQSHT
jgi:protein phosphatase